MLKESQRPMNIKESDASGRVRVSTKVRPTQ